MPLDDAVSSLGKRDFSLGCPEPQRQESRPQGQESASSSASQENEAWKEQASESGQDLSSVKQKNTGLGDV